jgi:hypothetical protein
MTLSVEDDFQHGLEATQLDAIQDRAYSDHNGSASQGKPQLG